MLSKHSIKNVPVMTEMPTMHIVINSEPEINLLTKCRDLESNSDIKLSSLCEQIERHKGHTILCRERDIFESYQK